MHQLREGWDAFTEHTWVWLVTAWISLYFMITYAPFFILGPYVSKNDFGGAGSWAAIVTGEGVGALTGGLVALRVRPTRSLVVIGAFFAVTAIQSVLLAVRAPVAAIAVAAALAGAAFSFGTVVWETSPAGTDPARAPLARERLQLDGGDGVPAGRVCDRRARSRWRSASRRRSGSARPGSSSRPIALLSVADVRNFRARPVGAEALAGA